jgi:hypothetical protein
VLPTDRNRVHKIFARAEGLGSELVQFFSNANPIVIFTSRPNVVGDIEYVRTNYTKERQSIGNFS